MDNDGDTQDTSRKKCWEARVTTLTKDDVRIELIDLNDRDEHSPPRTEEVKEVTNHFEQASTESELTGAILLIDNIVLVENGRVVRRRRHVEKFQIQEVLLLGQGVQLFSYGNNWIEVSACSAAGK